MRIGLYDQPTNLEILGYRGLYRCNDIIDMNECRNTFLTKQIDWFFSHSRGGMHIGYTDDNVQKLLSFYKLLKTENWKGEMVLFSDEDDIVVPDGFELLGYDIGADSMYYSPLGDAFLNSYDKMKTFFMGMKKEEYRIYKNDINENGLFETNVVAQKFAQYCNMINTKYPHAVESEENWRVFAIYGLIQ